MIGHLGHLPLVSILYDGTFGTSSLDKYTILAVARPPDGIHPKVIERGIHIRPYGIEKRFQNYNKSD